MDLPDVVLEAGPPLDDLASLDDALTALAKVDPQAVQLVNLRYFVGMTLEQSADVLAISLRTANRTWAFARAWLFRYLRECPAANGRADPR